MKREPVLYFDCTSTFRSGLNTGVQRVVRSLLAHKHIFEQELLLDFIPVYYQYDWYYRADDVLKMTCKEDAKNFDRIEFSSKDIYLSADAFWTMNLTDWLPFFRSRDVTVISVIYDLIPISHSEFSTTHDSIIFKKSLDKVITYSNLLVSISGYTAFELEAYLRAGKWKEELPQRKKIMLAPGDLDANCFKFEKNDFAEELSVSDYVLMVGTLEPRKGYIEVLKELETLWESGNTLGLVIVGKLGANSELIEVKVNELLALSYPIQWLPNVSDEQLSALYKRAKAVICASYVEGLGMPLIEAVMHECLVFANRLPVFGEVAGCWPVYFDIGRPGQLTHLLSNINDFSTPSYSPPLNTWAQSAAELAGLIKRVSPLFNWVDYLPPSGLTPEAVVWSYRIILGQELNDKNVIEYWMNRCENIKELRENLSFEVTKQKSGMTSEMVVWSYRIILGQELNDKNVIEYWMNRCENINELSEYLNYEATKQMRGLTSECVIWAYRTILGQEINDENMIEYWMNRCENINELCEHLMYSKENLTREELE